MSSPSISARGTTGMRLASAAATSAAMAAESTPLVVPPASAQASTAGSSAGASSNKRDAATAGAYYKGMAVFTVVKGGAMLEASIGGQKFKYEKKKQ